MKHFVYSLILLFLLTKSLYGQSDTLMVNDTLVVYDTVIIHDTLQVTANFIQQKDTILKAIITMDTLTSRTSMKLIKKKDTATISINRILIHENLKHRENMKKQILTLISSAMLTHANFAQPGIADSPNTNDKQQAKNCLILKLDLIEPAISLIAKETSLAMGIEKGFCKRHSIQLAGLLLLNKSDSFKTLPIKLIQIIPQYKFYLSKRRNFTGFYVGVYMKYSISQYASKASLPDQFQAGGPISPILYYYPYYTLTFDQFKIGEGGMIGYQNCFGKHIVLDFLFGLGQLSQIATKTVKEQVPGLETKNIAPDSEPYNSTTSFDGIISLNIGYKF